MRTVFNRERDSIAGLGLLASTYVRFDPAIGLEPGKVTHVVGFNVHCLVIDNTDGEVLALERNRIFGDSNPLQHAEQLGVRAAMARLQQKRPRPAGMTVSAYYKSSLFMEKGTAPDDYLNRGCTLYNTFDPCGMCAVTLLACYMKRIAYLFADKTFEHVYDDMGKLFKGRESIKEEIALLEEGDSPITKGAQLIKRLREKVHQLEESKTADLVLTLDHCREELAEATSILQAIESSHLKTTGIDYERNLRTLNEVKRLCNIG